MPQSPAEPASPADSRSGMTAARFDLPALAPCRLDLTVSALRRLATNMVDVLTPDGAYIRVLGDARAPVFVRVAQAEPKVLTVILEGNASEHPHALASVRRMLGVDRDLTSSRPSQRDQHVQDQEHSGLFPRIRCATRGRQVTKRGAH